MLMKDLILMSPGPTMVPKRVYEAEAAPMIHHRSPEFSDVLEEALVILKEVVGTKSDVFIFPSSGRGTMEASIVNILSPQDEVIAITNGRFGNMYAEIAEAYAVKVHRIFTDWEDEVEEESLDRAFQLHPKTKAILVSHGETSTAVENPLEVICRVAKRYDKAILVDAVSTMGGLPIKMDLLGIDVVASGSQKCLMSPAGIGIISLSEKAWEMARQSRLPKFYWDIFAMRKFLNKDRAQTPHSTPVSLVRALRESLVMIKGEGIESVFKRHEMVSKKIKTSVQEIGLDLFPKYSKRRCSTVTAALMPQGMTSHQLAQSLLQDYNIQISKGMDAYESQTFRVGHMGNFFNKDADLIIGALKTWYEKNVK